MSLRIGLGLFVCNAFWSANSVMAKVLLRSMSPLQAAWTRYAAAGVALALALPFLRGAFKGSPRLRIKDAPDFMGVGLLPFFVAPLLNMTGLSMAQATENSLIVATEPLWTVALAALFLGERLSGRALSAVGLAIVGFVLLASGSSFAGLGNFSLGNILFMCVQACEGSFSLFSKRLSLRGWKPIPLFVIAWFLGFTGLSAVLLAKEGLPAFCAWDLPTFGAAAWIGGLGSTFGYVYWITALQKISLVPMALSLFLQPLLGAVLGVALLGERLSGQQIVGGGLIFVALGIFVRPQLQKRRRTSDFA